MMLKQILKYMFIYLAFIVAMTALVSLGYINADRASTTLISSTPNDRQFSWPSNDQQPVLPYSSDSIITVLAKSADKLGVSTDEFTQAYEEAQSDTIPPSPLSGISQDGQAKTPQFPAKDMSGYLSAIFDRMSDYLGIPAADISAAWQATIAEIKLNSSTDSAAENR